MNESLGLKGTISFLGKHADGSTFIDKTIPNTIETAGKGQITSLIL